MRVFCHVFCSDKPMDFDSCGLITHERNQLKRMIWRKLQTDNAAMDTIQLNGVPKEEQKANTSTQPNKVSHYGDHTPIDKAIDASDLSKSSWKFARKIHIIRLFTPRKNFLFLSRIQIIHHI